MAGQTGLWLGIGESQRLHNAVLQCRLKFFLVASSLLHWNSFVSCADDIADIPSDADDLHFTMFDGYIAGDGDITSEYTTLTAAKGRCLEMPDCEGFTFMGGLTEGPMWVNFKSKWNVGGTGWTSFRREELPFTMFDGYIAGNDDVTSEYTTLTKAKVLCLRLPECKGFTYMGPPSEGPMWINFKKEWNIGGTGWTSYRRDSEENASTAKQRDKRSVVAEERELPGTPAGDAADTGAASNTQEAEPAVRADEIRGAEIPEEAPKEDVMNPPNLVISKSDIRAPNDGQAEDSNATSPGTENLTLAERPSYQSSLFVGELMRMTKRKVFALNTEKVVMCYTDPDVGGACRAANATAQKEQQATAPSSDSSASNTSLLPPLPWGTHKVFLEGRIGHIEISRLNSNRFVVCFERIADSAIVCSLGFVYGAGVGSDLQCTFGNSLSLGFGSLISVTPASAGQQLVACHIAKGDSTVTCRWADAVEDAGLQGAELRWAEGEPRIVQSML
jgi:hypothetical protein